MRRPAPTVLLAVTAALSLAGCTGAAAGGSATGAGCRPGQLDTVTPGTLTLSTGAVTRAPWVVGGDAKTSGDPRDGKGYDAAVGLAVAERLGYPAEKVTWTGTPFLEAVAPGPKDFDVNVNQATITAERRTDVDLSEPYYVVRQAVVTVKGRAVAQVQDLGGLVDVGTAAIAGSPSIEAFRQAVPGARPPVGYPDLDAVRGAVSSGRQDAAVVDFPTALQLDQDERLLVDGELVGLLPPGTGAQEEYGLVLEKGSPLTACVDDALAALRADGTLDRLAQQWLVDGPGYRLLR